MKKHIFIALFIISLIGPTALYPAVKEYLDQTNYENRTLASFPELSLQNFTRIPTEFEAYYNDHVPFKNLFVKAKTKMDLELLGNSSIAAVTVGTDRWMFYTVSEPGEDALADYQRTNLYTSEEKEDLVEQITRTEERLAERGIRFFSFEAPNKESVYGQYMPEGIKQYGEYSRLDIIIPELQALGLPVYDLKPALLSYADACQLYYKYDTHWNQLGAYVGSQVISEVLTGNSVPLEDVAAKEDSRCSGDMARMVNLAAECSDDWEYSIDGYLPEVSAWCTESNETGDFAVFESDSPNDKTLFVLGDSFSHTPKLYLPKLYRRTVFVTFDRYESSMLDAYEIDDFVYLTVERNQERFENMERIVFGEGV